MENSVTVEIHPRFRDTDRVGHVNNAVFVTYLEVARSKWYNSLLEDVDKSELSFIIARIEVDYLSPIYLNSPVEVKLWVSRIGTKSWEFSYEIINQEKGHLHARAKSVQVTFDYTNHESVPIPDKFRSKLMELLKE